MNVDRHLVAQAVLEGQLGPEHLTDAELEEIECRVVNFAIAKEMDMAKERGLTVIRYTDTDYLH